MINSSKMIRVNDSVFKLNYIKSRGGVNGPMIRLMYAMLAQTISDLKNNSKKKCNISIRKETESWIESKHGISTIEKICILTDISFTQVKKLIASIMKKECY